MGVMIGIVNRSQTLVPEHALPLIGIRGVRALHELEVVVMWAADMVVQRIIQPNIRPANEGGGPHVGAVQNEDAGRKRNLCRSQPREGNLYRA